MKKIGLFAAGVLFGTAGMKLLGSKDAKRAYAQTTAAALRAKDSVMTAVTAVREGAEPPVRTAFSKRPQNGSAAPHWGRPRCAGPLPVPFHAWDFPLSAASKN